jgi:hypothetical protein
MNTKLFGSRHAAEWASAFRRMGLFVAFLSLLSFTAFAQNDEWESEDEDETEETEAVTTAPSKKEDVTIQLNDVLFVWKDELVVKRNDTLTISVRDLAPASRVEIVADKGGINIGRKIFYSNNRGELDLEIRVGNKKMKGNITLAYTPSGASKKERSIHLVVD